MQRLNLITDVGGLRIGHAENVRLASGVTVALFDEPAVAAVHAPGGGVALRDADALEPDRTVERIEAIVLSGGSGFGLDAGSGAQAWLRERGRGLVVGATRIPIVPTAILFDLLNGGDKRWGRYPPYRELAYAACEAAERQSGPFGLGSTGAGFGATTVDLKGGIGSSSIVATTGSTVGAIVAVNAIGSAIVGHGPHFWAAPFEIDGEFGGLGPAPAVAADVGSIVWKGGPSPGTTLAIVTTNVALTKAQAKRLAIVAAGGLPRALRLAAAPMDGDVVFAVSTGRRPLGGIDELTEIGARAADCLARAVARGVYEATALTVPGALPAWQDRFVLKGV
ncbi:MAG: P1 family peptidase [Methylobacteriaceae bacterium]|nr:P1 family peptidase [Methylobacteriaceae bacterium]